MATYRVKSPDGRTVTLRGDTPPSDTDLDEIFSNLPTSKQPTIPMDKSKDGVYERAKSLAGIPFKERVDAFNAGGPVAAMGGAKNTGKTLVDASPDIYQVAGNIVGGGVGATMGQPVAGAAYGGSVGRGVGNVMKSISYGRKPTVKDFTDSATAGGVGELFGMGVSKAFESAVPAAKKVAKDLVISYLKPKGELLEKSGQLADTILKEDLARGNMGEMLTKASAKAQNLTREVDAIIEKYSGRKGTASQALSELDNLASNYHREGDPQAAESILKLKENLIQGRNLNQPKYGEVEKGAFVMQGGELTTPKKVTLVKSEPTGFVASGGNLTKPKIVVLEKSEPTGFILKNDGKLTTPKIYKNNVRQFGDLGEELSPKRDSRIYEQTTKSDHGEFESRTAKSIKENRVIPETTYQGRKPVSSETYKTTREHRVIPETQYQGKNRGIEGPSRKVSEVIGQEPRNIGVDELQDMKRAQYRTLARKKSGGGYGTELKSAEIEGRQNYASGLKREIENAIPEENIAAKNERISNMIDAVKALQDREPVASKRNFADIGDLILGGASFAHPETLGALAAKRMLGSDTGKNWMARNLYDYSNRFGPTIADALKNRYIRSLISNRASDAIS